MRKPEENPVVEDCTLENYSGGQRYPSRLSGACSHLKCGDCGARLVLCTSHHGPFYGCERYPECRGTLSAYRDGSPMGTPGNRATRVARRRVHDAFDRLWRGTEGQARMTRAQAYAWLREEMGLSLDAAHIGNFTIEQCTALTTLLAERFPETRSVWDRLQDDSSFED
jgi:ssDNA-binding Zn-finger/Zn-ribbon topoisomerase 1